MANGKNDYIAGIVNHPEVSDAVAIVIERRGEKYCVGADQGGTWRTNGRLMEMIPRVSSATFAQARTGCPIRENRKRGDTGDLPRVQSRRAVGKR